MFYFPMEQIGLVRTFVTSTTVWTQHPEDPFLDVPTPLASQRERRGSKGMERSIGTEYIQSFN